MRASSFSEIPSSVTFLVAITGIALILIGLTILMMLRLYGSNPPVSPKWVGASAFVINLGLLLGILTTFHGVLQSSLFVLITILTLTTSVPLILVWRLSTIPIDHSPWTQKNR